MYDEEPMTWCENANRMVPVCECGPHEKCPEHILNCMMWN